MNTFSDYLIYDERKGRILHSRYLNKAQFYEMWRFHFNRLRPDFSNQENVEFVVAQRLARGVFAVLKNENYAQIRRAYLIEGPAFPSDQASDAIINHLNYLPPSLACQIAPKMTSWIDATKSYNYIKKVAAKIESFGLQYPAMSRELTQEQKVQLEDQLYHYFKKLLTKE